jgi:hypothetical protein
VGAGFSAEKAKNRNRPDSTRTTAANLTFRKIIISLLAVSGGNSADRRVTLPTTPEIDWWLSLSVIKDRPRRRCGR